MTNESTVSNSAGSASLPAILNSLRKQLLDIGKRNKLIHMRLGSSQRNMLEIRDERSDEVFRILYGERKTMSFDPAEDTQDSSPSTSDSLFLNVYQLPDEHAALEAHHMDRKLATRLGSEALHKRLLSLYRTGRTLEEEQGVSVLFLALGFLRWYESETSATERFAPLVLLPVELQRAHAGSRFKLAVRDEDLEANLSLRSMLQEDFDLSLPDLPDSGDWLPSEYLVSVRQAVSRLERWGVADDTMMLGFFSFAKFLMWRDLAPGDESGEGLLERLLIGGGESGGSVISEAPDLDKRFPDPGALCHVLDADAAQAQVIAAAREGSNLVIQGPPGTGKSQTITNIIAGCVRDGKTILFVAEKRAALDVVFARLKHCGLGALCLELHSKKASRKAVYEELKETLALGRPEMVAQQEYQNVRAVRDRLNQVSDLLHTVDKATGDTPFTIIGMLCQLGAKEWRIPAFNIEGAEEWSKAGYEARIEAVATLSKRTEAFGSELSHPWRGASRRLSQAERRRLQTLTLEALDALHIFNTEWSEAAKAVCLETTFSASFLPQFLKVLDMLARMPDAAHHLLESPELLEVLPDARALCDDIHEVQRQRNELSTQITETALDLQWTETRQEIALAKDSILRWLRGSYRAACKKIESIYRGKPPANADAYLAVCDCLLMYQRMSRDIGRRENLGTALFGMAWRGDQTVVDGTRLALEWLVEIQDAVGSHSAVNAMIQSLAKGVDVNGMAADIEEAFDLWSEAWSTLNMEVKLDASAAFGAEGIDSVPLADICKRMQQWASYPDGMEEWHRLQSAAVHVAELGLEPIRQRLADGAVTPELAVKTLKYIRAMAVWKRLCSEVPELVEIDGEDRSRTVQQFQQLDKKLQKLAAQEIMLDHYQRLPQGAAGQIGILRGEVNKRSRHMRLRRLLKEAGQAVQEIKPVFLMSPMSVAQFLEPGVLSFDMLLIDEASQVKPADALGAAMRSRQIVVVGDQKQLPPTTFFDRQVESSEEDEENIQASQIKDMESILSLCEARALPSGMLRWHYRSRHPSLITVSDHVFYNNKLIFPPSPGISGPRLGMTMERIDGVYRRAGRRDNPVEAKAVSEAVLKHSREYPNETLGVVSLSASQQEAIANQIDVLRNKHLELEKFCNENREGAFFVKNLENVQGDERDVIYVSIGYGKDAGGYMSQSFGPISNEGGERRLNVLFTRSRKHCRVFSSIGHNDIRMDSKHAGPRVLKRFLKYAETGELDVPELTGAEMDSPFEESVASALIEHGFSVAAQVGSAGFKIDLAVYDPEDDKRFLLAVECDGARYHSSSWARERDRLRQIVLEGKGWVFHRIWSTDWFYNQKEEEKKLLEAIDRAMSSRQTEQPSTSAPTVIARQDFDEGNTYDTINYVEAKIRVDSSRTMLEADQMVLASLVVEIVKIEGPVHAEIIVRRLATSWDHKLGSRLRTVGEDALRAAEHSRRVVRNPAGSDFFEVQDDDRQLSVRNRQNVVMKAARDSNRVPPQEIDLAVLQVVNQSAGIEVTDATKEVARMMGYGRTPKALRARVEKAAGRLRDKGAIGGNVTQLRRVAS